MILNIIFFSLGILFWHLFILLASVNGKVLNLGYDEMIFVFSDKGTWDEECFAIPLTKEEYSEIMNGLEPHQVIGWDDERWPNGVIV